MCSLEIDNSSNDLFSLISLIKLMLFTTLGFLINFFNFVLAFINASLLFINFGYYYFYLLLSLNIYLISTKLFYTITDNYCIFIIFCYCYIYILSILFLFISNFFSLKLYFAFLINLTLVRESIFF